MKHNLFLMCGIPGSGKSTWLKEHNYYNISRDKIRFELVKEGEDYFSKEKKVFKTFVRRIQESIDSDTTPKDIYCDATHITQISRNKLLKSLNLDNVGRIAIVVCYPSLEEALRRNKQRTGRSFVPESAIKKMYWNFERPEDDEDRYYDVVYVEVPE